MIKQKLKIYLFQINNLKNSLSKEFMDIFRRKDSEGLTVLKTSNIFEFYMKLIKELVLKDLNDFQVVKIDKFEKKELDEELEKQNQLDNFFKEEKIITKQELSEAIRKFMTLILYREEDKENKIKINRNNIFNYLKEEYLWNDLFKHEKFSENFYELKKINIQINQIVWFYNYLNKNIEDTFKKEIDGIIEYINRNKEEEKPKDNINNLENQDVNHEEEEENEEHEESQNSENNSDDSGSDD